MIVLDTETTGLERRGAALKDQPHIAEFAAIKLHDETLEEVARMEFLCKPPILIPAEATAIHKITDEDVADKPPFAAFVPQLQEFFFGERIMVAHNCQYDKQLLSFELQRLGMVQKFPWPMMHVCTVEASYSINNFRLNLTKLHELATGEAFIENAHRAMQDVEALVRCVRWLHTQGRLK